MLITLQVVALASGRAGETIRVMDTTGRLRYRATVVNADLLRAELP
jgi:flagella basal body P-ring formation protein FlgA